MVAVTADVVSDVDEAVPAHDVLEVDVVVVPVVVVELTIHS